MKEKTRNRKWVIKFTAVFFVILLLLTFFSNTIMNYSLPQVGTQFVEPGQISSRIRSTGMISGADPYEVKAEADCKVKLVAISVGSTVNEGDLICTFEEDPNGTASEAEKALEAAKLSYTKYLTTSEISADMQARAEDGIPIDYSAYKTRLEAASAVVSSAKDSVTSWEGTVKTYTKAVEDAQKAYEKANDAYQTALEEALTTGAEVSDWDVKQKKSAVETAQTNLDGASESLESANTTLSDAQAAHQAIMDEMNLEAEVTDAYQLVVDAQADYDKVSNDKSLTKLTAPKSGTVASVNIGKGTELMKDDVIFTIVTENNGFKASLTVTTEQAKRVKVGDVAEIDESWYYSDVKGTVTAIRSDKDNPGKSKIIDIAVTGSVDEGATFNFSIGETAQNYDKIVPNGAIREDNKGKFIMTLKQKSSPLGNRYYAKRVNIEVVANDDNYSAISGDIEAGAYIITTSSKAIVPGDQVRLSDN